MINTPRDKNGIFNPVIIAKKQRSLRGFDGKIISMHTRVMSMNEIKEYIEEIYSTSVRSELISTITNEIIDKVSQDGRIINKTLYVAIEVSTEREKESLVLLIEKTEGTKFWLSVVTELKIEELKIYLLPALMV